MLQVVILSKLLSGRDTDGFAGCEELRVHAVNGQQVKSLRHLAELVHVSRAEFLRFDLDHEVRPGAPACKAGLSHCLLRLRNDALPRAHTDHFA